MRLSQTLQGCSQDGWSCQTSFTTTTKVVWQLIIRIMHLKKLYMLRSNVCASRQILNSFRILGKTLLNLTNVHRLRIITSRVFSGKCEWIDRRIGVLFFHHSLCNTTAHTCSQDPYLIKLSTQSTAYISITC